MVLHGMGQLNRLLSNLTCPYCDNAHVSMSLGDKSVLSWKTFLKCTAQDCTFSVEGYTSPRIFNSDKGDMPFDVNQRAVLHCTYRLVGLVVKASASRAEGPRFESRLRRDFFQGRVIPVT